MWRELITYLDTHDGGEGAKQMREVVEAMNAYHISKRLRPVPFSPASNKDLSKLFLFWAKDAYPHATLPNEELLRGYLTPELVNRLGKEDAASFLKAFRGDTLPPVYGTLARPDPIALLDLSTDKLPREVIARIPAWAHEKTKPIRSASKFAYNAAVAGAVKDLHVDHGYSHAGWAIGGRKLWILYPPPIPAKFFETWAASYDSNGEQENRFLPIMKIMAKSLEHNPYIAITSGETALYLPPETTHLVFTLEPGFLGAAIWLPEEIEAYAPVIDVLRRELAAVQAIIAPADVGEDHWLYQDEIFPTMAMAFSSFRAAVKGGTFDPNDEALMLEVEKTWANLKAVWQDSPYTIFHQDLGVIKEVKAVDAWLQRYNASRQAARYELRIHLRPKTNNLIESAHSVDPTAARSRGRKEEANVRNRDQLSRGGPGSVCNSPNPMLQDRARGFVGLFSTTEPNLYIQLR